MSCFFLLCQTPRAGTRARTWGSGKAQDPQPVLLGDLLLLLVCPPPARGAAGHTTHWSFSCRERKAKRAEMGSPGPQESR